VTKAAVAPDNLSVRRRAKRVGGLRSLPTAIDPRSAALSFHRNWKKAQGRPSGGIDVIDMFSGCGGMSAGFASLNAYCPAFRIAGAVDTDEPANQSYQINLCVKPLCMDIGKLARSPSLLAKTRQTMCPNGSSPLVLIGCAPCQGFSSHRKESESLDPRNSLFADFARIAAKLRPSVIVMENVPELLTDKYWPFVAQARVLLEKCGYFVNLSVHNMAEYGVPQERFRTLLLAMQDPFIAPAGFLPRGRFKTVRDAIGHLPAIRAGERHPADPMHFTAGHKDSTLATIEAVPLDGGSRPAHVGPECLRRAKERNGRAVYEDVYGRLFWDKPAITITAHARNPASGRYVHPDQTRGLSVREAALLQSFPSGYDFAGSLDQRFRQIGNAVPPAFAAFLAAHIFNQLQGSSQAERSVQFDRGITSPVGASFSRLIPSLKSGHRTTYGPK